MHKIKPADEPKNFSAIVALFQKNYPPASPARTETARWEAFKNEYQDAYKEIISNLLISHNGVCAYCEASLQEHGRQIENFIPKNASTPTHDYTCTFDNFLLNCLGGSKPNYDKNHKKIYQEVELSCGQKKDKHDPEGNILNPYTLPDYPLFTQVETSSGLLFAPDIAACKRAGIDCAVVENTIKILGLNTPRLAQRRLAIWKQLSDDLKEAVDDEEKLLELRDTYLYPDKSGALPSFYTTYLLCLADELPELRENHHFK